MTANSPIPAIANAIFDACGVRVTVAADHARKDPARARRPARTVEPNPLKGRSNDQGHVADEAHATDMSFADFRKWILDDHVAFARNLPGMNKYTSNVLLRRERRRALRRRLGNVSSTTRRRWPRPSPPMPARPPAATRPRTAPTASAWCARRSCSSRAVRRSDLALDVAPLCPAGHLPLKGGDRLASGVAVHNSAVEMRRSGCNSAISPLEGEMAGRPEGGAS